MLEVDLRVGYVCTCLYEFITEKRYSMIVFVQDEVLHSAGEASTSVWRSQTRAKHAARAFYKDNPYSLLI